jgi:hypothetical protein
MQGSVKTTPGRISLKAIRRESPGMPTAFKATHFVSLQRGKVCRGRILFVLFDADIS